MSRAARLPKTDAQLATMTLEGLNAELAYLRFRMGLTSTAVGKGYRSEIVRAQKARERRFGVVSRRNR